MNQRLFFLYNYMILVITWCVVSWRMRSCHRWAKDMLQALGSLAAPLIEPSRIIWSPGTITLECLWGRDSKERGDHEIIYLAWILCASLQENPIFGAKILGVTEIQALDCRNILNGFRVQPELKLVTLVFYRETEVWFQVTLLTQLVWVWLWWVWFLSDNTCILMHPLKQAGYGVREVFCNGVSSLEEKGYFGTGTFIPKCCHLCGWRAPFIWES